MYSDDGLDEKIEGDVFCIPFGHMLIFDAHIPHAGGYRWSKDFHTTESVVKLQEILIEHLYQLIIRMVRT